MSPRSSRRRNRRGAPPPSSEQAAPPATSDEATASEDPASTDTSRGFGKATLILALLLGTLVERSALSLPDDARNIFHFIVLLGIALLVAGAYRAFARRAIERSRSRRRKR